MNLISPPRKFCQLEAVGALWQSPGVTKLMLKVQPPRPEQAVLLTGRSESLTYCPRWTCKRRSFRVAPLSATRFHDLEVFLEPIKAILSWSVGGNVRGVFAAPVKQPWPGEPFGFN
jgi:hypothetical protein